MARVRTYSPRKSEIERGWRVIDAEGETLGRLATRIATVLRGKDKPTYTAHMSVGDNVIVINAEKVRVTGQKEDQKTYYRHTQYPGGLRAVTLSTLREKHPERIIQNAVKGMLPHNRLGRQNLRRLHVYAGPEHPHEAQVRAGMGAAGRRKQAELEAQAAAPEPVATPEEAAPVVPPTRRRRRAAAQESQDATPSEPTAVETTTEAAQGEGESYRAFAVRRQSRYAAQLAEIDKDGVVDRNDAAKRMGVSANYVWSLREIVTGSEAGRELDIPFELPEPDTSPEPIEKDALNAWRTEYARKLRDAGLPRKQIAIVLAISYDAAGNLLREDPPA